MTGVLWSRREMTVAYVGITAEAFTTMDTTGGGLLDGVEVAAGIEAGTNVPL